MNNCARRFGVGKRHRSSWASGIAEYTCCSWMVIKSFWHWTGKKTSSLHIQCIGNQHILSMTQRWTHVVVPVEVNFGDRWPFVWMLVLFHSYAAQDINSVTGADIATYLLWAAQGSRYMQSKVWVINWWRRSVYSTWGLFYLCLSDVHCAAIYMSISGFLSESIQESFCSKSVQVFMLCTFIVVLFTHSIHSAVVRYTDVEGFGYALVAKHLSPLRTFG